MGIFLADKGKIGFELLLALAVIARPLIKWIFPGLASIEPIIPLAILGCILYGPQKGSIIGAGGYIGSNLLLASLGPWTIPQAIAGLIAGFLPSMVKRKGNSSTDFVWLCVLGTIIFEFLMNFWGGGFEAGYFANSITFGFTHIIGNVVFAVLLSGSLPAASEKKSEKKEEKK
ncbi:MAG: hypothetical protein Q7R70_03775 [Candidatus Diapherotrites archaeon]|nr:hypothetical protein [Candidatus Diapherotrites archaeon]